MFKADPFIKFKDIPDTWIFENYLDLEEELEGQTVKLHTFLGDSTRRPSFGVFFNERSGCYNFKCHSSGKGGNSIELVKYLFDIDASKAMDIIKADYLNYLKNGGKKSIKKPVGAIKKISWELSDYTKRPWSKNDAKYWSQYTISSDLLEEHNVVPLVNYTVQKKRDGVILDSFTVKGNYIYGYFDKEGDIYKIYAPFSKNKFFYLTDHIQGIDQCKGKPGIIVASSMKDLLSLKAIGITNCDIIAPPSETNYFAPSMLEYLKTNYEYIVNIFDNDPTGIKYAKKLEHDNLIPFAYLSLSKDVSDSIVAHGPTSTLIALVPSIHRGIEKYKEYHNFDDNLLYCREKSYVDIQT